MIESEPVTASSRFISISTQKPKVIVIGLAGVSLSISVLCGLSAFYGIDFVRDKIVDFTFENLSKILTKGPFLMTVTCCIIGEVWLVGYEKCSLKRLLNPSKSAQCVLYLFMFNVTGIMAFLEAAVTLGSSEWLPMISRKLFSFEILYFIGNPWVKFAVIYLVLDLAKYWVHRMGHTWEWCWEAHKLHHAATELNMITALRQHPLDGVIGVLIVGIPTAMLGSSGIAPLAVVITATVVLSMLHHSNLGWTWGWLGKYVICSPRYHQIHHSLHKDHTNKNYCEYIVVWDWIFGTRYDGPIAPTKFGFDKNHYNKQGLVRDLMEGTQRVYIELGAAIMRSHRSLSH